MRSEPVRGLILIFVLVFVLIAGCKPGPHRPDAAPPWWKPAPGEAADWDIQLADSPFDVSAPRAMYALDLWDVVPAPTTLDYADGALTIPAGAHAGAIAELHALATPAIVVCSIGTGAIRLDDPDATKFPGYAASPPNRPAVLATGSVIGWSITDTDPNERWIDIRAAARATVAPLIGKRIELAKTIGCDAIAARNNDLPAYEPAPNLSHGFVKVSFNEYVSWTGELSDRAHGLTVSIGSWNKSPLGADELSATDDWTIVERCAEHDKQDCVAGRPFLNKAKAVFAIEYDLDEEGMPNTIATLCSDLKGAGIKDGIIKSAALSSTPPVMRCP